MPSGLSMDATPLVSGALSPDGRQALRGSSILVDTARPDGYLDFFNQTCLGYVEETDSAWEEEVFHFD
jgi:hypothetical protein